MMDAQVLKMNRCLSIELGIKKQNNIYNVYSENQYRKNTELQD